MELSLTKYGFNCDIEIKNCMRERCVPGKITHYRASRKDYFLALHYVFSGRGTMTVGDKTWEMEKGYVFYIPPHVELTYTANANSPWEYAWVRVEGPGVTGLIELLGLSASSPCHPTDDGQLRADFSSLVLYCRDYGFADPGSILRFLCVVSDIDRCSRKVRKGSSAEHMAQEVRKFILYNCARGFTLRDISFSLNADEGYLENVFKKYMGMSIGKYKNRARVIRSRELMSTTDWKLTKIAEYSGFSTLNYYSRVYKKIYGESPSVYLKSTRGK